MLTVAKLESADQAASYYQAGDYYAKEEDKINSKWFGKGAEKLGLFDEVNPSLFKEILAGNLPDGTIMFKGYNAKGEETRRPGYDLTFSASKSASMLSFKDPRIVEAHNQAVTATLEYIEKKAAARVKRSGVVIQVETQNLVVATFLHGLSRALDPDLHTHCIVANMTEVDGKWRSLYGDDFYNSKKHFGLQYRLEFAQRLMKIGYEIEQTSQDGLFEIKGVPLAAIKKLSKRREEILNVLQNNGLDSQQKVTMVLNKGSSFERVVTTVASSMANFVTRLKKKLQILEPYNSPGNKKLTKLVLHLKS